MRELVVSNTSPLFYLHRLQRLDLLQKLYGRIIVPGAVAQELAAGREEGYEVPDLTSLAWIQVREVPVPAVIQLVTDLGPGEAEVLALALEQQGKSLAILDDGFARQVAKARGIRVTGTARLLLRAKQADLIPAVGPALEELQGLNNFRLSETVVKAILKLAGE